jgi:ketopantoate hydroxymethyltransferase
MSKEFKERMDKFKKDGTLTYYEYEQLLILHEIQSQLSIVGDSLQMFNRHLTSLPPLSFDNKKI